MNILSILDVRFTGTNSRTYQEWANSYFNGDKKRQLIYGMLGFFCFDDLEVYS